MTALTCKLLIWLMIFHVHSEISTTSYPQQVESKVLLRSKRDIDVYSDDDKHMSVYSDEKKVMNVYSDEKNDINVYSDEKNDINVYLDDINEYSDKKRDFSMYSDERKDISVYSDDKQWRCPKTYQSICILLRYERNCNAHSECPGNQLCCLTACSYDCARPVPTYGGQF